MPYIKRVHLAQSMFVEQDICAWYMTNTESYSYSEKDAWHYLSQDFINMGEDFAEEYIKLVENCKKQ